MVIDELQLPGIPTRQQANHLNWLTSHRCRMDELEVAACAGLPEHHPVEAGVVLEAPPH